MAGIQAIMPAVHTRSVMKNIFFAIVLGGFLGSCTPVGETNGNNFVGSTFTGEPEAIERAETLFAAIGGKEKWAALRSLYIHAIHEEPQLKYPYKSEIWRDIQEFKLRIEQQSEEFHRVGVFSDEGAWINYVDRDTARQLSAEALRGWESDNDQNVYVLLNRLSREGSFDVRKGIDGRIEFRSDTTFLCAFQLDSLDRPHRFITRNSGGVEQVSHFAKWGTTEGLVHSAGGGPLDGSFTYDTREWVPSSAKFEEAYTVRWSYSPDNLLEELGWLTGEWMAEGRTRSQFEKWERQSGNSLGGLGYAVQAGDTLSREDIQLRIMDDALYYLPAVQDQNQARQIPFRWVATYRDRHVFSNPEHDFPQFIAYEYFAPDSMEVRVWSPENGEERSSSFRFSRRE